MAKKSFPCWVCKGEGTWIEPVTDEGQGPTESCAYCEGQGMIEIGGPIHRKHTAVKIAMEILHFNKDPIYISEEGWSWDELIELGNKALNLTTTN